MKTFIIQFISIFFVLSMAGFIALATEENDLNLQEQYAPYSDDVDAFAFVRSVETTSCIWTPINDSNGTVSYACSGFPDRHQAAEASSTQQALRQLENEIRRLDSRVRRLESRVNRP